MKKYLTSGLVLLVLGVFFGLILALVNSFTAPIIAQNALKEKMQSMRVFYPNIDDYTFEEITLDGDLDTVYLLKSGDTVEAAIYSVKAMGYKTEVNLLIAVNKDLTIQGYSFISNGGTEGFGLTLSEIDFGLEGESIENVNAAFDAVAGASRTSGGVLACFELVAQRVATDLGGE